MTVDEGTGWRRELLTKEQSDLFRTLDIGQSSGNLVLNIAMNVCIECLLYFFMYPHKTSNK